MIIEKRIISTFRAHLTECTLSYCLAYNQKYINLIKIKIKITGMQQ